MDTHKAAQYTYQDRLRQQVHAIGSRQQRQQHHREGYRYQTEATIYSTVQNRTTSSRQHTYGSQAQGYTSQTRPFNKGVLPHFTGTSVPRHTTEISTHKHTEPSISKQISNSNHINNSLNQKAWTRVSTRITKQGLVRLPHHWYPSVPAYQETYQCQTTQQ
jgi:hypothetical protein